MPGQPGTLYLIPTILSEDTQHHVIPPGTIEVIRRVTHYVAENERTARRYLSSLKVHSSIEALSVQLLNKDTLPSQLPELLSPLSEGFDMGLLSESGTPCLADPGSLAVDYAHRKGIRVVPLVGPSSILLALMASGLNGQRFAFHGYLPIDDKRRAEAIVFLERESRKNGQTQIFIETPYRNNQLMRSLLNTLHDETLLCIAMDLTGQQEVVLQRSVRAWKKEVPEWPKLPAIFLFLAT